MGEVYLAEHRHLKRKAAVKLLARELVGRPDLLERFFLEARATSAIAHPGIVQIFDCEVDPTGRPYIVMEFLEGETLAAVISKRGPLPAITVAKLTRSMAEALEAAHAKGIVHRDLKPENVFVQAEPPDTAKLVDFGIAKLAGDFRAGQVHQTRSGAMMGTPLYMSPEQCRDSANIDHRTDLYSLGCVMFEMLTGRPPFVHDALGDLVVAHMTTPAPDARTVNAGVPAALAELANDLLKKNPAERPGMRQVADRMMGFIGGLTTVPESAGRPAGARTAPPATKNPTTFGETAAELVTDAEAAGFGSPKRGRVAMGLLVAALVGGGGAFAAWKFVLHGGEGTASAPSAMPAALPPAATAAPGAAAPAAVTPVAAGPAAPKPATPEPATARAAPSEAPAPATASAEAESRKSSDKKGGRRSPEPPSSGTTAPAKSEPGGKGKAADTATPAADVAPTSAASSTSAASAASASAASASAADLTGNWEGPWNDPGKQQKGRLYLQIAADGGAAGWMYNEAAQQSFRMLGRMTAGGHLDLACQCPRDQQFWARGSIRLAGSGEVKGQLSLAGAAGVFGQSNLTLKHTNAVR